MQDTGNPPNLYLSLSQGSFSPLNGPVAPAAADPGKNAFHWWKAFVEGTLYAPGLSYLPVPPLRSLAVIADVGQTYNTTELMSRLMGVGAQALALIGKTWIHEGEPT